MFSFNTSATLHHITPLPSDVTFDAALAALHNHDLLIRLDPEFAHYETLPAEASAPNAKRYKVTDHMHALPKGLWDSTVTFEAQITDTDDGIDWVILAPLGLRQKTTWRLKKTAEVGEDGVDAEGMGEWCLVEDVVIEANRLLVGTVKGKCEENWRGIHGRFVERTREGAAVKA